jgi:predicted RNase H-like HicB family nuclease
MEPKASYLPQIPMITIEGKSIAEMMAMAKEYILLV